MAIGRSGYYYRTTNQKDYKDKLFILSGEGYSAGSGYFGNELPDNVDANPPTALRSSLFDLSSAGYRTVKLVSGQLFLDASNKLWGKNLSDGLVDKDNHSSVLGDAWDETTWNKVNDLSCVQAVPSSDGTLGNSCGTYGTRTSVYLIAEDGDIYTGKNFGVGCSTSAFDSHDLPLNFPTLYREKYDGVKFVYGCSQEVGSWNVMFGSSYGNYAIPKAFIDEDGRMFVVGTNIHGELGADDANQNSDMNASGNPVNGWTNAYFQEVTCPAGNWAKVLIGGKAFEPCFIALTASGDIYTWGKSAYLQGMHGTRSFTPRRVPHPSGKLWRKITCTDSVAAALDSDGDLFVWGKNNSRGMRQYDYFLNANNRYNATLDVPTRIIPLAEKRHFDDILVADNSTGATFYGIAKLDQSLISWGNARYHVRGDGRHRRSDFSYKTVTNKTGIRFSELFDCFLDTLSLRGAGQ
tara:strand:- start:18163 stop:19554 length:1392 start_codon:yes stop_codon:yes gene_type:complete